MNVQNKSETLRRSERLKTKEMVMDVYSEGNAPATDQDNNGPQVEMEKTSAVSKKSRSSQASKIKRAEMENTLKKKKLEQEELKKRQEILDLELALKLAEIEEESETSEEPSVHESVPRPNVRKWIKGQNPWDNRSDKTHSILAVNEDISVSNSIFNNRQEIFSTSQNDNLCQATLPQITKILARQSLPKDLPPFDGNPINWPNFIYQYRNSTAICGYTNEENQSRLQKCLKGNAKKVVEYLLIMPQNVEEVINLLKSRFGRPEHIIMILFDRIKKLPTIKEDKTDLFIEFSDEVKNFIATIDSLKEEDHLRNPILLHELLNKLPTSYRLSWVEHISKIEKPDYKLKEFVNWLDKKADAISQIQIPKPVDIYYDSHDTYRTKFRNVKKDVTLTTNTNKENNKRCFCCNNEVHLLTVCPKFKSFTPDERWSFITAKRVCFSCLVPFHNIKQCKRKKICGIHDCKRPHHELLHKDSDHGATNCDNTDELTENAVIGTNCHISTNKTVLLKILPVEVSYGSKKAETFVLLDDASTVTLIDQEFADSLKLGGPRQALCLQWTNEDVIHQENNSRMVSFTITAKQNGSSFQLRHVRTTKLSLPTQTIEVENIKRQYPYINNKISSLTNAQPKIIIGQDNWPLLVNRKLITGPWNGPALSKTLLGWVIHGNVGAGGQASNVICHINHDDRREKDDLDLLHDMVKEQWKIDFISGAPENVLSVEDRRAQKILDLTMKRTTDRYETGLLWRDENVILPESKTNALQRLKCCERKMDRDKAYGETYCEKFLDLENKGYIRRLTREEAETTTSKTWYLPHFGVINPNKPKKLRIVFDASAKSNGISLNDCLLTGPDLYNSLYTILLNFRIKKYAFTADIKEMFLQVKIRPEDRHAQRILWRGMNRHMEPDVYEIMVVFFGSTSGPCLAQEAKNRNANDFKGEYPQAAKAIIEQHYMDDYLGNADTEEKARKLVRDVVYVHKQGGFDICNWIANDKKVLHDIDVKLIAEGNKNLENNNETAVERILGVFWNSNKDIFSFQTKFHKIDKNVLENRRRPTKREVLKVVMSIFDPLGFLAKFLIQGKVLLQDIWRSQIGWDDDITDLLNEKWQIWLRELRNIYNFEIPRQYFTLERTKSEIQLHVFCDASEKCYAAVAYLRVRQGQKIQTSFVNAKTRVAPLKPVSIPRLELQAALIGARLGHTLKKSLDLKISNIFYWSDSKTVFHWIRSEARRFKVFVAQRLGEIQDLTNVTEWKYVSSKENVADEATKRLSEITFNSSSRWIKGPKFLLRPPEEWPQENKEHFDINTDLLEIKHNELVFLNFNKEDLIIPDPERFSKWPRILRTTAYVLRFIDIAISGQKTQKELNSEEIQKAEILLFRKVQLDSFSREIYLLKNKKSLSPTSRLYTLTCTYSQSDGLLRLSGRLDKSSLLTVETKYPIILDPNHKITKLLIQSYHEDVHHHGQETVINNLRQKFWILRIRQAVKSTWNNCQHCKNRRATPKVPIMGQLPTCRIEPTIRPFIKTGVDYFGPMEVTVKRSHERRYGVIFTCMVTRAVYIEIAHDLSTNSFINVLRRFGCRRGFPEELFSDNGTNFRGAEKEISEHLKNLQQDEIMKFCSMKKIKWNFNAPLACHMGGSWERLIQSIKKILKEVLKLRYPPEHILRTFLIETENILNSRPLTHVSLDSDDAEALTPNHFLIGPAYAALPCIDSTSKHLNLLSSWRASQKLADLFWSRWIKEYLPTMIRRTKWYEDNCSIKLGDIVIMVDPSGPRNLWQKGVVVAVFPAKDGKIRMADVRNSRGTILRRPVSRLIVLDVKK